MQFALSPFSIAFLLLLSASTPASASPQADERTAIGQKVGDLSFLDIRTLERSLSEFGERDAFVLVFTTTTCPLVQRYLPRLKELHERFGDRAQFVAINVGAADSIRAVAAHGLESGALFPFVKDRDGSVVDAVGVTRTPEVAVLDRERRLVYRGRIDDQYRLGGALPAPRRHDLAEALEELLAGRDISVATTPVDGCLITRPNDDVSARSVTYHRDVAPIVEKSCVSCHQPGTAAPFSLQTYASPRPAFLVTKDFINEIRRQNMEKAAADAPTPANPHRGRQLYRSRSPSGRSRSDRSSHSSGRSSRSRDKPPWSRHSRRSLLLGATDDAPADNDDPDDAYCQLMTDLHNVAVETNNSALLELLENAAHLYHLCVKRAPDDEEVAAGIMYLNYQVCAALAQQDLRSIRGNWPTQWHT